MPDHALHAHERLARVAEEYLRLLGVERAHLILAFELVVLLNVL